MFGAALGGESHIDGDVLLTFGDVVEADFIDQTEIDDVDGDFGVVALLECVQNVILGYGHGFPLGRIAVDDELGKRSSTAGMRLLIFYRESQPAVTIGSCRASLGLDGRGGRPHATRPHTTRHHATATLK